MRDRKKVSNEHCFGCVWGNVIVSNELIMCPFVRCVDKFHFNAERRYANELRK